LRVLDQTLLPGAEVYRDLLTVGSIVEAVQALRVRGAPFLGLVGAAGMAVAANERGASDDALRQAAHELATARPTAVDLSALVHRALAVALALPESERLEALWQFAQETAEARQLQD